MAAKSSGLEGITVCDTAISTVGKEGVGLTYRGYDIEDLAKHSTFEEVAYLLIYNELPTLNQLKAYRKKLVGLRRIPNEVRLLLETISGSTHPMDVLRTAVSMLGGLEDETEESKREDIADRLLACLPTMLLYWYQYHLNNVRLEASVSDQDTIAGYFLELLHDRKPDEETRRAMDVSLILYAEHELNASTFAARVTSSTESDFYSAIVSAIGALRGPLHGGANEEAMRLLSLFQTPSEAEKGIKDMLAKKAKIMGFGHRVYKTSDPRSKIIKEWSHKLSKLANDGYLFDISERIEKIMWDEKKIIS